MILAILMVVIGVHAQNKYKHEDFMVEKQDSTYEITYVNCRYVNIDIIKKVYLNQQEFDEFKDGFIRSVSQDVTYVNGLGTVKTSKLLIESFDDLEHVVIRPDTKRIRVFYTFMPKEALEFSLFLQHSGW